MADLFCSFLDFRSLTKNSNLHVLLPSKHYYSSASHNSRISGTRRRPLHLTLLSKPSFPKSSSPDFDVISTHEHPDGSLLFRFGDPNEIAKNAKLEESKTVKKGRERGNKDGLVKVLDGDHETEGPVQKTDAEVTGLGSTGVAGPTSSIDVSSKSISVDEGIDDSCEKLLEGSNDIESPVISLSAEMEVGSVPDVEHYGNIEDVVNEDYEDSSATGYASMLDKSSEMENIVTKETADVATVVSLVSDSEPVIALPDDDVVQASMGNVVTTDVSADSGHQNMETETQNESIEDGGESVKTDLVSPPPQSEPAISLSEEIEDQNLQAGMQNLIIGEESESDTNDHVPIGMQILVVDNGNGIDMNDTKVKSEEAALGAEAQASGPGTGFLNEIVEYESESDDMVQLTTVSPQSEAEPLLDKEPGPDNVEESREDVEAENLKELNNTPQNSIVGLESTEVDNDVQRGDLVEASVPGVTVLKSTESVAQSEETVTTDFVLSSGAALLPHPSKVEKMRISLLVKHGWV